MPTQTTLVVLRSFVYALYNITMRMGKKELLKRTGGLLRENRKEIGLAMALLSGNPGAIAGTFVARELIKPFKDKLLKPMKNAGSILGKARERLSRLPLGQVA